MNKLREYIGPTLVSLITDNPRQKTVINSSQGRWYIVEIIQRKESITSPFNQINNQVTNETVQMNGVIWVTDEYHVVLYIKRSIIT